MDTLPAGLTEEDFFKQIQFALLLRNSQNCSRQRELVLSDCLCSFNPDFYNCAIVANQLLAELENLEHSILDSNDKTVN